MSTIEILTLALACLVTIPVAVLSVQCLSATLPPGREEDDDAADLYRPQTVVLVPAHNEEQILTTALDSVLPQLGSQDRVLVVAHNCTDGTARLAREYGAEVLEVQDDGTGGKPDALKAGLRHLAQAPPEVVVIIDADCHASEGAIEALSRKAFETGGPVQGVYLFSAADERERVGSISSLALLVKNRIRPLGLHLLDLPCLLNGSGSAYPFQVLHSAPHGEGSIAEDYQLSIDLALSGYPTRFCPAALVESRLPGVKETAYKQRKRWEHGHLQLVLLTAPRLLWTALRRRSLDIGALALDLTVPPLAFLALLWATAFISTSAVASVGGGQLPVQMVLTGGGILAISMMAAWLRFAGMRETVTALGRVPFYILWKVPLYASYLWKREKRWTKTSRDWENTNAEG